MHGMSPTARAWRSTLARAHSTRLTRRPRSTRAVPAHAGAAGWRCAPTPTGVCCYSAGSAVGSVPIGTPMVDFADNDDWFDDVSDGPVTAAVTDSRGGRAARSSACIDDLPTAGIRPAYRIDGHSLRGAVPGRGGQRAAQRASQFRRSPPTYSRVLQQVADLRAHEHAYRHRPPDLTPSISAWRARGPAPGHRRPDSRPNNPRSRGHHADALGQQQRHPASHHQARYAIPKKWREGPRRRLDRRAAGPGHAITPDGLTGPRSRPVRVGPSFRHRGELAPRATVSAYSEPFRLDHAGRSPSDVTKQMAVPSQADFLKCTTSAATRGRRAAAGPGPPRAVAQVDWLRKIVSTIRTSSTIGTSSGSSSTKAPRWSKPSDTTSAPICSSSPTAASSRWRGRRPPPGPAPRLSSTRPSMSSRTVPPR